MTALYCEGVDVRKPILTDVDATLLSPWYIP